METAFERWMRNNPDLDSQRFGVVRYDCDVLLHRYKTPDPDGKGSREIQCLMFLEVKTHDAELTEEQRDTLSMFNQVLRNRKTNIHQRRKGRHARDHTPLAIVYSFKAKRDVRLWLRGGHLLQLSGDDPIASERIRWDGKPIDLQTLLELLRFERDPDSPKKLTDWRRRYSSFDLEKNQLKFPFVQELEDVG